jgi:hypothetical protein
VGCFNGSVAPTEEYIWLCLAEGCGRRETSEAPSDSRRCDCGEPMMGIMIKRTPPKEAKRERE